MRRLIWFLVISILCFGCKPGIPKDIIKPDKMQKILYDIHVADGYISTIYIPDSAKRVAAAYYKGIYKKFDTDSVRYTRSMTYYSAHPDELDKMYKNISKILESQKKKMQKADSLITAKATKALADAKLKDKKAETVPLKDKTVVQPAKVAEQKSGTILKKTRPAKKKKKKKSSKKIDSLPKLTSKQGTVK